MQTKECLFVLLFFLKSIQCQIGGFDYYDAFESGGSSYKGKYIGDLSTFHHQVRILNFLLRNQ